MFTPKNPKKMFTPKTLSITAYIPQKTFVILKTTKNGIRSYKLNSKKEKFNELSTKIENHPKTIIIKRYGKEIILYLFH